jgi:membrane protein implicated in regulation of membrane protease activity
MLVYVYLFAFALGGLLLLASIFLGDKDGGHDTGHDTDADAGPASGPSNPGSLAHDGAGDHGGVAGVFTAFLSLRFWMFFLAFFGLTGLVLDGLDIVPNSDLALVLAVAMGILTGEVTVHVFRRLAHSETSTAAGTHDYVGKSGRVLIGFGPGAVGKLRLTLKGTTVDVLASTDEERPFVPGDDALVIQMNDTTAVVARVSARN